VYGKADQMPVLFNRRALAVSVAVLVAGGGLAYSQLGVGRRKKRGQVQPAANGTSSDIEVFKGKDSAAVPRSKSKGKAKRGGLKSVKILGSILLAQMGKPGMQNLLGLAAFAV
jgi:hypothetical protein